MSDPSFSGTVATVKESVRQVTAYERDFWNSSPTDVRQIILNRGKLEESDLGVSQYNETASESYQEDFGVKINQLLATEYDELPDTIKGLVTEALVEQGSLPNPNQSVGVGLEYAVGDESYIECDRCDESFFAAEDFDEHKKTDHGDEPEQFSAVAESVLHTMNPDMSNEALRAMHKIITEGDQGDLYRKHTFVGTKFEQPTTSEPDDVKGKVGYDDNPNEGLYDNKLFREAPSIKRHEGFEVEGDEGFEDDALDAKYEGLSDITTVPEKEEDDKTPDALEGVNFAEEAVDFDYYPTIKETVTESVQTIEGYTEDFTETEEEAMESLIVSRKLHGYGAEVIARELSILYGMEANQALEKVGAVEVSNNDRLANTFFGKKFNECTEAEIAELRTLSGADNE